ncbi:hypothetical protein ANN_16028 [Periplaneta americana]|uniref:Uncharacterized protein n=1 Tax=Periplaneta americana TaxID=6978 RepID=A0ABQ8SJ75_PERAM|nr:hypothetical protein ANN_16028 [Periplaneta americana]
MAGLCEGCNEPAGSLKAICNVSGLYSAFQKKQQLFQKKDGLSVHIREGPMGKTLFGITLALIRVLAVGDLGSGANNTRHKVHISTCASPRSCQDCTSLYKRRKCPGTLRLYWWKHNLLLSFNYLGVKL